MVIARRYGVRAGSLRREASTIRLSIDDKCSAAYADHTNRYGGYLAAAVKAARVLDGEVSYRGHCQAAGRTSMACAGWASMSCGADVWNTASTAHHIAVRRPAANGPIFVACAACTGSRRHNPKRYFKLMNSQAFVAARISAARISCLASCIVR
jgi:hypothetical protein